MKASPPQLRALLVATLLGLASPAPAQNAQTLKAAQEGDPAAQVLLGYAFRDGNGAKQNHATAFSWFSKAADQGYAEGLDNLGWLVEHGMGTPKDEAKARTLYLKAAGQKHPPAINNLARCLREGIGGPADQAEALKWTITAFHTTKNAYDAQALLKALIASGPLKAHEALIKELGEVRDGEALCLVARIHHEGLGGFAKDPAKAREYFAKARRNGMGEDKLDAFQLEEMAGRPRVKGQFAYMATRHLDQGWNMCAPTSAAMGLEFYLHKPVDPYAIKRNSTGATEPGTGTAWDFLMHGIKAVSGHDWEFRSWPNDNAGFEAGLPVLLGEMDTGRIALIDLGPHTVVLAGYDAARKVVFIQNPANGYPGVHTVTYEELRQKWHSPWHVSTTKGVEARPVLLTAGSLR